MWDQVLLWGSENSNLLTGIGLGCGIIFVIAFPFVAFSSPRKVQPNGEKATMKRAEYIKQDRARRLGERQRICEMFEDGLLDLYVKGQISNSAYNYWHGHFSVLANVRDFTITSIHMRSPEELKDILKKRRNGGTYHGIYIPVNLPKADKEVPKKDAIQQFLANFR